MRVVYATQAWSSHDARFLRAIVSQGHRVWFASQQYEGGDKRILLPAGVDLWPVSVNEPNLWETAVQDHGIELVHAGPIPSVAATIASARLPCAFLVMSWGSDVLVEVDRMPDAAVRAQQTLAKADLVFADCAAVVEKLGRLDAGSRTPCVTFPWGLELARFQSLPIGKAEFLRRRLGWQEQTVLISTRSWEPGYGTDVLLDAFSVAVARNPSLRLILVSGGALSGHIHKRLARSDLSGKVHCPGYVAETDLPSWLCAADLYVSPTPSDGTSISLLEAMACRLPAIARNRFGNLEWIAEGRTGWLVDCTDTRILASAIECALNHRNRWAEMGNLARKEIFRRADWEKNSSQITLGYERARQRFKERG